MKYYGQKYLTSSWRNSHKYVNTINKTARTKDYINTVSENYDHKSKCKY